MHWYLDVLRKYIAFQGRARRSELWMFLLINLIISTGIGFLENLIGIIPEGQVNGPISGLYALAVLLPAVGVGVRRLHDTGRSGFWLLLAFTLVGYVVLFVFWALDSEPETNKYGSNPKAISPTYS